MLIYCSRLIGAILGDAFAYFSPTPFIKNITNKSVRSRDDSYWSCFTVVSFAITRVIFGVCNESQTKWLCCHFGRLVVQSTSLLFFGWKLYLDLSTSIFYYLKRFNQQIMYLCFTALHICYILHQQPASSYCKHLSIRAFLLLRDLTLIITY